MLAYSNSEEGDNVFLGTWAPDEVDLVDFGLMRVERGLQWCRR